MKPVVYTHAAAKAMAKLPRPVRESLMAKIEAHAAAQHAGRVKKLKGEPNLRIRSGDYRVIFDESADQVLVVAVGHRRDIYR